MDTVWNLCDENGKIVTLYAQWFYSGPNIDEENDLPQVQTPAPLISLPPAQSQSPVNDVSDSKISSNDTMPLRLTTPKIKSVKKKSKTSLRCIWSKNTKATGYEVRLKVGNKVYKKYKIKNAKTTSKTMKKLLKGRKYKIQVRAYKELKGAGTIYSAWSASKNIKM
jgi:hypothetical protein